MSKSIEELSGIDLDKAVAHTEVMDSFKMNEMRNMIRSLAEQLSKFAENPNNPDMDKYSCHNGICSKESCSRCGNGIASWKLVQEANRLIGPYSGPYDHDAVNDIGLYYIKASNRVLVDDENYESIWSYSRDSAIALATLGIEGVKVEVLGFTRALDMNFHQLAEYTDNKINQNFSSRVIEQYKGNEEMRRNALFEAVVSDLKAEEPKPRVKF